MAEFEYSASDEALDNLIAKELDKCVRMHWAVYAAKVNCWPTADVPEYDNDTGTFCCRGLEDEYQTFKAGYFCALKQHNKYFD